jgi:hypothetical protein
MTLMTDTVEKLKKGWRYNLATLPLNPAVGTPMPCNKSTKPAG